MKLHTSAGVAFAIVVLATVAYAADHTHIDNHSQKWTIIASTSYPGGHSKFKGIKIPPGRSDVDPYNPVLHVDVDVQIDGGQESKRFRIKSGESVVAEDVPDNDIGLDFWLNDGSGHSVRTRRGKAIPPLVTIFGPEPPSPTATPSPPSPTTTPSPPADTPDVDYGVFMLPDSDNNNIQLVTDPSITSHYPSLRNEASCTNNCLFKRSKDDISPISTSSDLFRDFTNTVALWALDSVDRATGSTTNILRNSNTRQRAELRIDRQATNIQVPSNGQTYNYNLYAVQVGGDTLASVRVPTGYNVGTRRIRHAFLESQRRGGTVTIFVPTNAPYQDRPTSVTMAGNIRSLLWLLAAPEGKIQA